MTQTAFNLHLESREIDREKLRNTALKNPNYRAKCAAVALEQARADPSDPHTYARVYSLLTNGCALPSDFHVEWRKEHRTTEKGTEYTVDIPHSMKRP